MTATTTISSCDRCGSTWFRRDEEGDLCCQLYGKTTVKAEPETWRGMRREPRRMPDKRKVEL